MKFRTGSLGHLKHPDVRVRIVIVPVPQLVVTDGDGMTESLQDRGFSSSSTLVLTLQ